MHHQRLRFVFLMAVGSLSWTLLIGQHAVQPAEHQSTLVVYPNATGVSFVNRGGVDLITYHVNMKFPASDVTAWISNNLEKGGWEPLSYDWWNPKLPRPVLMKGWRKAYSGQKIPGDCVHVWVSEWKNHSGDIVRYDLRYKQQERCTPDAMDLEVNGVYVPSVIAQQQPADR